MAITTTPSGGPQGEFSTYTPIYATTLTSTPATVTFSNIPQNYTDLVLVINGKDSRSGYSDSLTVQLNGDTGSSYSNTDLSGNGTAAASNRYSTQTVMRIADVAGATGSEYGTCIIHIMNYSNNTTYKTLLGRGSVALDYVEARVGLWRNTSPITSINIPAQGGAATWVSGSTFTLYGIKAAATQFIPTKAAGGDIVATDGTYAYHAFLSTGSFKAAQALTADILVVAGGGGGSGGGGSPGGAGGLIGSASYSLTSGSTYTCTVGAGGAAAVNGSSGGFKGANSQFGSITAAVGGGDSGYRSASGSGGSGAGGISTNSGTTYAAGSGTAGQGNNGGAAAPAAYYTSGGGGGAGAVGTAGTTGQAGAGGIGATYNTTVGGSAGPYSFIDAMGAATGTGEISSGHYYYAGGGGAGGQNASSSSANGVGGLGGGGKGATANGIPGTPGSSFTGGGGGGGWAGSTDTAGGAGGSGIVIVRYAL